ncbi:MAG: DUF2339 domain-containing protein [Nitriliruptorales bacterium]|nr:DUF2339 domain-containing protein [Nitriliruptorales bacterium]
MASDEYEQLQATVQALTRRVYRLEHRVFPPSQPEQPQPAPQPEQPQPAPSWVPPRRPEPLRSRLPRVELTASRLLAIVGGLVLLLGTGYLLRYAAAQGWLGPEVRVLLALGGSAVLAAVGLRLERVAATRVVGQICTATATAGSYAAVVAAASGYHLIPERVGLAGAAVVAGAAAARGAWTRSQGVAALGIGGALVAPVLVQAGQAGATLGFLVVALAAGLAITVRRDWRVVTGLAFALVTPQVWMVAEGSASTAVVLGLAAVTAALFLGAATAHAGGKGWEQAAGPGVLAVLNAASVALLGYSQLEEQFIRSLEPGMWLAGVAAVHLAVGVVVSRRFFAPPFGIVLAVAGVLVADAAILAVTSGYVAALSIGVLALAAAQATWLPWLRLPALAALLAQLGVAAAHGVVVDVPAAPAGSVEAMTLVAAVSAFAVLVGAVARPAGRSVAAAAAVTYGGLGLLRLLSVEAPLSALLYGPRDLGVALIMCAVSGGAMLLFAQLSDRRFTVAAVAIANYAVSLAAVAMDPDGAGRVALTGLWAVGGGVALVAGRRLRRTDVRRGGTALLGAAVAKAALVDTVMLSGTNRAVALLLCGTVLVATAIAEARAADRGEVPARTT